MARRVRAGSNSCDHRRAPQQRDRKGACRSTGAQELPGLGTGADWRSSRTVRPARSRGLRQAWTAGEGLEHQGGIAGQIMPFSTYLPDRMGTITLAPRGPFVAGAHVQLSWLTPGGAFGIDATGMVRISWRTTPKMTKPQFDKPQAANFTTVE